MRLPCKSKLAISCPVKWIVLIKKTSIKIAKPPAGIVEKIVEKLWIKMLAFKNDL